MHQNKQFSSLGLSLLAAVLLLLTGCAASHSGCVVKARSLQHLSLAQEDEGPYVYTAPQIYRTWINAHVTSNDQVVSPHYRYWVKDPGHWNVPLHTKAGEASLLITPAEASS